MNVHINARFHSGNIAVTDARDPAAVRLQIRPDEGGEHYQWFHFELTGARDTALNLVIENAGGASYPKAWSGYRACASYDGEQWFRVDTRYSGGELHIAHKPTQDRVAYAYFAPYPEERHRALLGRLQARPGVHLEVLGETLDGRSLDLLTIGEGELPCWIIARQHPGETMAEWLMEGLMERLTDPADAVARALRARARFYLVPNMNPDGSARGHLRTNASGANLNREWAEPSLERSPEVKQVRDRMDATGLRFCLDVHGDEELPYNFIAGSDGVEGLPERVVNARHDYEAALRRACPDFQSTHGYPRARPGTANLTMCTNQVAQRFGALAMTLEQPFKDNDDHPMPGEGWSPRRCQALGRAQLDALAEVLDALVE